MGIHKNPATWTYTCDNCGKIYSSEEVPIDDNSRPQNWSYSLVSFTQFDDAGNALGDFVERTLLCDKCSMRAFNFINPITRQEKFDPESGKTADEQKHIGGSKTSPEMLAIASQALQLTEESITDMKPKDLVRDIKSLAARVLQTEVGKEKEQIMVDPFSGQAS